jgi:hypothetical protein
VVGDKHGAATGQSFQLFQADDIETLEGHQSNQIKSNQIKSNQIKSNQIKTNQIKSNQIKSNQIKSNQIKSNQINGFDDSATVAITRRLHYVQCLTIDRNSKTGVDVMITFFCDFRQFSPKKLAFSQKPML